MKPVYRAAVIGCGRIGDAFVESPGTLGVYTHAEAYVVCPRTELIGVCDINAENLRRCADRWKIASRYRHVDELLAAEAPEIVSICTPDATHYELASAALEAPATRAVLVEKPLSLSLGDARKLVATARERGITLAVNYSRRYADCYHQLRDDLGLGKRFGMLRKISGYYTKGILHNGSHGLDLCRFFGGEIRRVQAFPSVDRTAGDPTPDVRLEFASGATAFFSGCDEKEFSIFEMDLLTSAGRARLTDSGQVLEFFTAQDAGDVGGYRYLQPEKSVTDALRDVTLHAVEDLVACLDECGREPRCSGSDAVAALKLGLAIVASASRGEPVDL